jgi:hypothetical protein
MAESRWLPRYPAAWMRATPLRRWFRPRLEILEERNLLALTPVNPLLFGLNQPWIDGSSYLDPGTSQGAATRDAVARLGVQAMRYTGGTVSTYWDWQTADYVSDAETHAFPQVNVDARKQLFDANGMAGPDGFYAPLAFDQFSQQAGFQTLWVPNLATGDSGFTPTIVNHAADMFNFLSDNGVPVKYVEMGNEYDLGSFTSRFTNSQGYIRNHVNAVASRVRQLYPDAEIGVVGHWSGPIWGPPSQYAQAVSLLPSRQATWDSGNADNRYFGGISNFDAVVYHNYRMNSDILPADAGTNNENWQSALLAFPEASLSNAAENARSVYGNDIHLWMTEFGINHTQITGTDPASIWLNTTATNKSTWDALFTAGFYLTAVQQNDTYQTMMRHDLAQLVNIAGPDGRSYATISPTGQVMAHLFNLAANSTQMGALTLPDNPVLPVSVLGRDQLGALQGVEFTGPGTETFVILNRGNADQNIALPNDGGFTRVERWVYRADANVVPGGFAPIPDGPAPWVQGTPMDVVHEQATLDSTSPITFLEPAYSLEFVTVSTARPAVVQSVAVNDGAAQRSMVNSLTVTFSTVVSLDPGAFELVRQGGGVINLQVAEAVVDGHSVDTLTFLGAGIIGGSLADGHYTLTIHGSLVHDEFGQALDGAGMGVAGSDAVDTFFRLFGDADGDGHVDLQDLLRFGSTFGMDADNPGYLWYFDYNGDGRVDVGDLLQLLRRLGR